MRSCAILEGSIRRKQNYDSRYYIWTAEGVDVIHSVEELKRLPLMDPEVMVIGGAEIFSLMMPLMSRMWVSHISGEYPADTWLPPFEDRFRSANLHEQFEGFDLFLYE